MKKKSRRPRSSEASRQTGRTQMTTVASEDKRPSVKRGRHQRSVTVRTGTPTICHDDAPTEANYSGTDTPQQITANNTHSETKSKSSRRLSSAICRLCHGKFSPRSLRHAFNKWPQESITVDEEETDAGAQSPILFHTDFQQLVGVQLDRDPRLSEFVCKKCYTKFYKCHSILVSFLQRVNLPPVGKENSNNRINAKCPESSINHGSTASLSFSSDPKCLHSLVSWTHHHAVACRSCPNLKEVLEGQYWGSVKAVWCCVEGHSYTMDTQYTTNNNPGKTVKLSGGAGESVISDGVISEGEGEEDQAPDDRGAVVIGASLVEGSPPAVTPQTQSSALDDWTRTTEVFAAAEEAISPALAQLEDRPAYTDLSDRVLFEEDFEGSRKGGLSEDELFEPYSEKRARRGNIPKKRRRRPKAPPEPKIRKKPGPKPGWKNKFKTKGEELPNIFKCPYPGCTAVYRAPDGLKKHIKEHHEEVRERPCPHPGCNKVFMIDRYLQRHVKLIHTEERNYICDQCGQTFKQRKHLSVHQMRHSGAKPLQCEICGFQCRQRASLKYHMTKHKAEADLDFACLMCGKRFEKAHNLNVHMSMVHPLIQAKVQRVNNEEQQQPQQQQPPYSNLHTITPASEAAPQEQDR
ncbi:zinc finger protein 276 [Aulostomus maculatus]